jgi:hypothetical protein
MKTNAARILDTLGIAPENYLRAVKPTLGAIARAKREA